MRPYLIPLVLAACGGSTTSGDVDASTPSVDSPSVDAAADVTTDDFERPTLGSDWTVIFPPPPNDQVRIIGGSDLGMGPGPQGFFLVNYTARTFDADQFGEATIPTDVDPDWIHQVYVRSRASDRARYGFGYDGDPGQAQFGNWIFKYDGVPSAQTRVFGSTPATTGAPTWRPHPCRGPRLHAARLLEWPARARGDRHGSDEDRRRGTGARRALGDRKHVDGKRREGLGIVVRRQFVMSL